MSVEVRVHEGAGATRVERALSLIDEAARPRPLPEVLGVLCAEVAAIVDARIASIYVREDDGLVLRANVGFPGEAIDQVRLAVGEGITGFAAEVMRPVTVMRAPEDEHFKPVPGLGEEDFPIFLALPILVGRRSEAVLVLQRRTGHPFTDDEVLLASALATAFAYALERSRARREGSAEDDSPRHARLRGRGLSEGMALGRAETSPTFEGLAAIARARGIVLDADERAERLGDALDHIARGLRKVAGPLALDDAKRAELEGLFVLFDDQILRRLVEEKSAAEPNPALAMRDVAKAYARAPLPRAGDAGGRPHGALRGGGGALPAGRARRGRSALAHPGRGDDALRSPARAPGAPRGLAPGVRDRDRRLRRSRLARRQDLRRRRAARSARRGRPLRVGARGRPHPRRRVRGHRAGQPVDGRRRRVPEPRVISLLLWLALAVLAFLAVAWVNYVVQVRRYTLEMPYEEVERLPTPDGSHVELRRLPRNGEVTGPPVLLVHGLALNHRNNDLTEDLSLGRHLAKAGRDVWLLTLRSGREDLPWREERIATFERMAENDLVVGVDAVLERTGAERLDYVGFSMGGMLMYAAGGQTLDQDKLRRVVIVGSPARIRAPLAVLSKIARMVPHWIVPTLRLRHVSNFMAFSAELIKTPIHRWIYNHENVDRGLAAYALVNGFVNIPSGLAIELVGFAADDGEVRFRGRLVDETLRAMSTPVLFVAGADDRLAPPEAVRIAHDAWGADTGAHREFRVAGIEQGAAADYGHGDLAIGRFADQDVFDPVAEFLSAEELEIRDRPDDERS